MSWSFNLTSQDNQKLKAEIEKQEYCPAALREHLSKTVDHIEKLDGYAIRVESNGHHDTYQSYGSFRVERVKVSKEGE